jgi:hypothetical protein
MSESTKKYPKENSAAPRAARQPELTRLTRVSVHALLWPMRITLRILKGLKNAFTENGQRSQRRIGCGKKSKASDDKGRP